jgi:zinc transport system substrate-binding protein
MHPDEHRLLIALAMSAALLIACGKEEARALRPADARSGSAATGREKPTLFVSILPQAFFVERLVGDLAAVEVLVGPGQSPEMFEPTPKQMTALAGARALFLVGMGFEQALVSRVSEMFPDLEAVHPGKGIELAPMDEPDPEHGAFDPHFWLDPTLALKMSASMADTLVSVMPEHKETIEANLARLATELGRLDAELSASLAPCSGRLLVTQHGAFGYFCRRYGLVQVAVSSGHKEEGARHMAEVIDRARAAGVKAVFVQPQFSREQAAVVAEAIGAGTVVLDPLPRDYVGGLRGYAAAIRASVPDPAAATGR